MSSLPEFTFSEVAAHNSSDSLWLVIDNKVYDVTKFLADHPGGQEVLLDNAGKDATGAFADVGHSEDAINMRDTVYLIGTLKDAPPPAVSPSPSPAVPPQAQSAAPPAQSSNACSCCGSENCRGKLFAGVGAVVAGLLAIGIGVFLYKRYAK